jgi:hypothetical protein
VTKAPDLNSVYTRTGAQITVELHKLYQLGKSSARSAADSLLVARFGSLGKMSRRTRSEVAGDKNPRELFHETLKDIYFAAKS